MKWNEEDEKWHEEDESAKRSAALKYRGRNRKFAPDPRLLDIIQNAGGFVVDGRPVWITRADQRRNSEQGQIAYWVRANRPDVLTPAQHEALTLYYGTPNESREVYCIDDVAALYRLRSPCSMAWPMADRSARPTPTSEARSRSRRRRGTSAFRSGPSGIACSAQSGTRSTPGTTTRPADSGNRPRHADEVPAPARKERPSLDNELRKSLKISQGRRAWGGRRPTKPG